MKIKKEKNEGFTLIETLIYIGVIGLALGAFLSFSLSFSQAGNKTQVAGEVHQKARNTLNLVAQKIRQARAVNIGTSVFDDDSGVLSLEMADPQENPTLIFLDQGIVKITEAGGSPVALFGGELQASRLIFSNLTGSANVENIKIKLELEYARAETQDFQYSQILETAVNLRK